DVKLDIVNLRSDGVKFQWELVGAWNDVPDGFAITVGPHANSEWTPWPENCSDMLYCNQSPCQKDTKNVGECESVQGCRSAQITVTASGISSGQASASRQIVTAPSSGAFIEGKQTPDYTPQLQLQTDSDGSIIISWEGPANTSDGECATKALVQYWVDGKTNIDYDFKHNVLFNKQNRVLIQPAGVDLKEVTVEVKITYMVKVDGEYMETKVFGKASTDVKNGSERVFRSAILLVLATFSCTMFTI
ncbi:unnamed protein product, partial [Meganyctiphanes norvegica]